MTLTKEHWKDPEFRKKMIAAKLNARQNPIFQDIDPDAVDSEGNQLRPAYIPVTPGPRLRYNTDALEKSLQTFCKEAHKSGWIDQETKKKAPKINTEFNNGPLSFTKEKLEEWNGRQAPLIQSDDE